MKKKLLRIAALLLAGLLSLGAVACNPADNGKDPTEEVPPVDYSADGVFDINDYDSTKTYTPEDLSELIAADYVTLGRFEGLTLTLNEADYLVTDELLQTRIDTILAENHPDAEITNRVVAWNDTVLVDYVGTIDGVAFSGGSATNQTIAVTEANAKSYIPGFIEGLVGVQPGVATPVEMTFPEDYHNADVAGKDAVFTFTVHYIVGSPELTDDFVAEYTEGKFTSAEEYKADLRREMNEESYDLALRQAFWDKINENAAVKKYPEQTVLYYYGYYCQLYSYYGAMYGLTLDVYLSYMGMTKAALFEACCGMIKSQMVYYAVFAAKNYTYTEEQYQKALELYTDNNLDALNEERAAEGKAALTREEAMEYFDENGKSTLELQALEEIAYDDLIKDYTIEIVKAESKDETTGSGEAE